MFAPENQRQASGPITWFDHQHQDHTDSHVRDAEKIAVTMLAGDS